MAQHHADYANYAPASKTEMLEQLLVSYEALSADTDNWVANMANCASLLWHGYYSVGVDVNWTGFYVNNPKAGDELILGPFQGKVACQIIKYGKGVCGTAIATEETQLVPNVEEFPGHIACDGETKSEIVVPIVKNGAKVGVLDLDCLQVSGFDDTDRKYLEKLVQLICTTCAF